jgi:hypothetical protein
VQELLAGPECYDERALSYRAQVLVKKVKVGVVLVLGQYFLLRIRRQIPIVVAHDDIVDRCGRGEVAKSAMIGSHQSRTGRLRHLC